MSHWSFAGSHKSFTGSHWNFVVVCFVFNSLHSFSYEKLENSLRYSVQVHVCSEPDIERGGLVQTRVVMRRFGVGEVRISEDQLRPKPCGWKKGATNNSDSLLVLTPRSCNTSFRFCLIVLLCF